MEKYRSYFKECGCGECKCNKSSSSKISTKTAIEVAVALGYPDVDINEFKRGLVVELEHGNANPDTDIIPDINGQDNLIIVGKIVLAHLSELPDYYTRLDQMEKEGKKIYESSSHWSLLISKKDLTEVKRLLKGLKYKIEHKQDKINLYFNDETIANKAKDILNRNNIRNVLYPQLQPELFYKGMM